MSAAASSIKSRTLTDHSPGFAAHGTLSGGQSVSFYPLTLHSSHTIVVAPLLYFLSMLRGRVLAQFEGIVTLYILDI